MARLARISDSVGVIICKSHGSMIPRLVSRKCLHGVTLKFRRCGHLRFLRHASIKRYMPPTNRLATNVFGMPSARLIVGISDTASRR